MGRFLALRELGSTRPGGLLLPEDQPQTEGLVGNPGTDPGVNWLPLNLALLQNWVWPDSSKEQVLPLTHYEAGDQKVHNDSRLALVHTDGPCLDLFGWAASPGKGGEGERGCGISSEELHGGRAGFWGERGRWSRASCRSSGDTPTKPSWALVTSPLEHLDKPDRKEGGTSSSFTWRQGDPKQGRKGPWNWISLEPLIAYLVRKT